jgi:hypothetical protein
MLLSLFTHSFHLVIHCFEAFPSSTTKLTYKYNCGDKPVSLCQSCFVSYTALQTLLSFTPNYSQVLNSYTVLWTFRSPLFLTQSTSLFTRHSFLRDLNIINAIMNYTTYCLNCKILSLNLMQLHYDGQNIQTYENFCMEKVIWKPLDKWILLQT